MEPGALSSNSNLIKEFQLWTKGNSNRNHKNVILQKTDNPTLNRNMGWSKNNGPIYSVSTIYSKATSVLCSHTTHCNNQTNDRQAYQEWIHYSLSFLETWRCCYNRPRSLWICLTKRSRRFMRTYLKSILRNIFGSINGEAAAESKAKLGS